MKHRAKFEQIARELAPVVGLDMTIENPRFIDLYGGRGEMADIVGKSTTGWPFLAFSLVIRPWKAHQTFTWIADLREVPSGTLRDRVREVLQKVASEALEES